MAVSKDESGFPDSATVALVGLWQNRVSATTRPDRVVAATEYWWRKWLPLLGWERWFLVTSLRWLYSQQVGLDEQISGDEIVRIKQSATGGKARIEFAIRELAVRLGMSEKVLYRLLTSEPSEEKPWRRLAVRDKTRNPDAPQQTELLRIFIPRLRYLSERRNGVTRRTGMQIELVMDELPTPADAARVQSVNANKGISTLSVNANKGISTSANANKGTHACMHANNNNNNNDDNEAQVEHLFVGPPTRHSHALTVKALTSQYPVQPDGLDPDRAFNLALDKALALLPAKLCKRADAPLYALAGELHPTAREHPSRAWPDAGGAGWILDAVLDAIAKGPVGSVNLFRAITDRWLAEGNPYAVKPPPVDDPLAVFVQLADDYTPSDRDRRHLSDLHAEGYSDDEIVAGIQRAVAGARQRGAVPRSFGYCVPAIREIPPSQPSRAAKRDRAAEHDRGTDPGAVTRTGEKAAAVPPEPPHGAVMATTSTTETDPVMAEVVGMYESEIGSVTGRTVQRLMALTEEHRDIDKWREAFDAVVQSNVRRLDYLVKCLENAGKPKPRPKPGQHGRGYKQRQERTIREKPLAEDVDAETRARQRAALAELKERQLSQPSRR